MTDPTDDMDGILASLPSPSEDGDTQPAEQPKRESGVIAMDDSQPGESPKELLETVPDI